MRYIHYYIILSYIIFCFVFAATSCSGVDNATPVKIQRFDSVEVAYTHLDSTERKAVLLRYRAEIGFLTALYGSDSPDSLMEALSRSRSAEVFGADIRERLASLQPTEIALGEMWVQMSNLLPDVELPHRVSGMILPYRQSVVIADTLVVVGLNHYLGSDYPGYEAFDTYTRARKTVDHLPLHIAEALIVAGYPYQGSHSTVLSRLLYEGALIETMRRIFPHRSIADIMGYTPQQFDNLEFNEATLWQRLIAGNMLYTLDQSVAASLIEPGDATEVISGDAPPRAGRYIGWRIIDAYCRNHPHMSPEQLLSPRFYLDESTLKRSGFVPNKR